MKRREFWSALLALVATPRALIASWGSRGAPVVAESTISSTGPTAKKILRVRRYRAGYEVRRELHSGEPYGCEDFEISSAYTPNGHYIGNPKDAFPLCRTRGIIPERREPHSNVCSIGFSQKDGKWYGWSHRAIYGFKPGDVVEKGSCCADSGWTEEWLADHPEDSRALPVGFKAKDWADARKMAVAFAASVS